MDVNWKCVLAGLVGFVGGVLTGAAGTAALADKLIALDLLADTRAWQIALLALAGLVGGLLGAGASLAAVGCLNRADLPDGP